MSRPSSFTMLVMPLMQPRKSLNATINTIKLYISVHGNKEFVQQQAFHIQLKHNFKGVQVRMAHASVHLRVFLVFPSGTSILFYGQHPQQDDNITRVHHARLLNTSQLS